MAFSPSSPLAALTAPVSTRKFLSDFWPERRFVSHGDPGRLPGILRVPELQSFAALAKVYRGKLLFASGANSPHMVPIETANASTLFDMGLTVYFSDVEPFIAGADEYLRSLEAELGVNPGAARIGAFASPRTDGAPCHYDVEEVISIQLRGVKTFEIAPVKEVPFPYGTQYTPGTEPFEELYPQVTRGFPDWQGADFESITMQPGSVLFMPRGTWHRTAAGEDSLSVSIILRVPSALDCVLDELKMLLLQEPQWRRPLYGAWGEGAMQQKAMERAGQLLAELPQRAGTLTGHDLLLSMLPEARRNLLLSAESRYQRNPQARIELGGPRPGDPPGLQVVCIQVRDDDGDERTTVRMGIQPDALSVFRWLEECRSSFDMADLQATFPRIPADEARTVLEVCVKGELVKLLWFPPSPG